MDSKIASPFPVQQRVALRAVELEAIELAAQGLNQREIGEKIGRTRSGVSKMLARTERKQGNLQTGASPKSGNSRTCLWRL